MTRTVQCSLLKKEAEGLSEPPFPGEFGKKIYNHISKEAWGLWQLHQTRLINEYRLNLLEQKSKEFLFEEMQKFLFNQ